MSRATLILIDIQKGFDSPFRGDRNSPGAKARAAVLPARWRAAKPPSSTCATSASCPAAPSAPAQS